MSNALLLQASSFWDAAYLQQTLLCFVGLILAPLCLFMEDKKRRETAVAFCISFAIVGIILTIFMSSNDMHPISLISQHRRYRMSSFLFGQYEYSLSTALCIWIILSAGLSRILLGIYHRQKKGRADADDQD